MHQKEISVTILQTILPSKMKHGEMPIEGYIRNQKLNLIVDEAYFMDAYRLYRSMKMNWIFIHIPLSIRLKQNQGLT